MDKDKDKRKVDEVGDGDGDNTPVDNPADSSAQPQPTKRLKLTGEAGDPVPGQEDDLQTTSREEDNSSVMEVSEEEESGSESSECEDGGGDVSADLGLGGAESAKKPLDDHYPFQVLSTEQILQHMIQCIQEANVILQLPPTTVRFLLNHFKWDNEKLLEAYYAGDKKKLFEAAHVMDPSATRTLTPTDGDKLEDCGICFLDTQASNMYGMQCGHRFCTPCWTEYLTMKITKEGMGQTIACAAHNCPILVDDATVMMLVTDPQVKRKYQHYITNGFVECHRLMRWCPSANCTNAIRVDWVDWRPVTCSCRNIFCFQCGNSWHGPVKCVWLRKWIKKMEDDSETSNWIVANTKECPKCHASIEKNGGCNHMTCRNVSCRAEFCWICLGDWASHRDYYNCNRYNSEGTAAMETSRAALERFLFYCNRYGNHMQSLKFENKLYDSMQEKMKEMQKLKLSWIEVQFLNKAVDILCECRQTLMYTYVFAFYLQKTNQQEIFENNQRDLEAATETLSEYLEKDVTSASIHDIKQKVQDKSGYCEKRRKALVDHVYEGYDENWWTYRE